MCIRRATMKQIVRKNLNKSIQRYFGNTIDIKMIPLCQYSLFPRNSKKPLKTKKKRNKSFSQAKDIQAMDIHCAKHAFPLQSSQGYVLGYAPRPAKGKKNRRYYWVLKKGSKVERWVLNAVSRSALDARLFPTDKDLSKEEATEIGEELSRAISEGEECALHTYAPEKAVLLDGRWFDADFFYPTEFEHAQQLPSEEEHEHRVRVEKGIAQGRPYGKQLSKRYGKKPIPSISKERLARNLEELGIKEREEEEKKQGETERERKKREAAKRKAREAAEREEAERKEAEREEAEREEAEREEAEPEETEREETEREEAARQEAERQEAEREKARKKAEREKARERAERERVEREEAEREGAERERIEREKEVLTEEKEAPRVRPQRPTFAGRSGGELTEALRNLSVAPDDATKKAISSAEWKVLASSLENIILNFPATPVPLDVKSWETQLRPICEETIDFPKADQEKKGSNWFELNKNMDFSLQGQLVTIIERAQKKGTVKPILLQFAGAKGKYFASLAVFPFVILPSLKLIHTIIDIQQLCVLTSGIHLGSRIIEELALFANQQNKVLYAKVWFRAIGFYVQNGFGFDEENTPDPDMQKRYVIFYEKLNLEDVRKMSARRFAAKLEYALDQTNTEAGWFKHYKARYDTAVDKVVFLPMRLGGPWPTENPSKYFDRPVKRVSRV